MGSAVPIAAALQRAQPAANRSRDLQESLWGHSEQSHPGLLMHLNVYALDGAFCDGFCPYKFGEQAVVPSPDFPLMQLCQVSVRKSAPSGCHAPSTQQLKASRQVPKCQETEGTPRGTATLRWRTLPHVCLQVSHLILSVMKHNPLLHTGKWHQLPMQGSQWSNLYRKRLLSMIESPSKTNPGIALRWCSITREALPSSVSPAKRNQQGTGAGTKRGLDTAMQG